MLFRSILKPQGGYDWVAMTPSDILPPPPSATTARLRHPAVPDFAAEASLEPDSGANRIRAVADAIDRIAASEAVNGIAKTAETAAPVRAKFVAAARRAAQAVVSEHKVADPLEKPGRGAAQNALTGSLFARLRPRTKSAGLGVSMVLLVSGALGLAPVFFHTPAGEEQVPSATQTDDTAQRGGEDANARLDETTPGPAPGWAVPSEMAAPAAIATSAATPTPAATLPPYPPPGARGGGGFFADAKCAAPGDGGS